MKEIDWEAVQEEGKKDCYNPHYQHGKQSYELFIHASWNPFEAGTKGNLDWERGWMDARKMEQAVLDSLERWGGRPQEAHK